MKCLAKCVLIEDVFSFSSSVKKGCLFWVVNKNRCVFKTSVKKGKVLTKSLLGGDPEGHV